MKKIRVLYYRLFKRAIIDNCLDSAYEDVNSLIENVFTNIGRHGFKLTYEELVYLFDKYDWKDIIDALEEVENSLPPNDHQNLHIDLIKVIDDYRPVILRSKWSNSYLLEWLLRE